MNFTELAIKLIAKIGLLVGVALLFVGGFSVESDMLFATKMFVTGICFSAPDVIMQIIEGIYAAEK